MLWVRIPESGTLTLTLCFVYSDNPDEGTLLKDVTTAVELYETKVAQTEDADKRKMLLQDIQKVYFTRVFLI